MNLPLHPIAVHFPIALGLLVPLLAIIVALGIVKWKWSSKVWGLIILANVLLLISSLVAVKLGGNDEELVEKFVQRQQLHDHEEWGEKIPWFAGAALALSFIPLFMRKKTAPFYVLAILASIAMIVPIMLAGHSGGKLVYQEGAANAHIKNPTAMPPTQPTDD